MLSPPNSANPTNGHVVVPANEGKENYLRVILGAAVPNRNSFGNGLRALNVVAVALVLGEDMNRLLRLRALWGRSWPAPRSALGRTLGCC